jgi:hypothetical protein
VKRTRATRRGRPRAASERDQHESAFTAILAGLVVRVPGAKAAALVDFEGETVDYAGRLAPFALRLAAAHWRIVLDLAASQRSLRHVRWISARAARASYLVHALPEGYALVVVLARAAGFVEWRRAVAACGRALGAEAGWRWAGLELPVWVPVEVAADERKRPSALRVAGRLRPLEVLGALAGGGLARRERGWRVRFESGIEATLVRERGGAWYADEPVLGQQERAVGQASRATKAQERNPGSKPAPQATSPAPEAPALEPSRGRQKSR